MPIDKRVPAGHDFRSYLGDAPVLFAAAVDDTAPAVTVSGPSGVTTIPAGELELTDDDRWGSRWAVRLPEFTVVGPHTVVFHDDGGRVTSYLFDVADPADLEPDPSGPVVATEED